MLINDIGVYTLTGSPELNLRELYYGTVAIRCSCIGEDTIP
jgi:hypothetical protein